MIELYIDPRGELAIENVADLLDKYPNAAERAVVAAMKSAGNMLRGEMKSAVEHGGPSGSKWQQLNPHTAIISRANQRLTGTYQGLNRPVKLQNFVTRTVIDPKTGQKKKKRIYWYQEGGKTATRQRGGGRSEKQNRAQVDISARRAPLLKFKGGLRYNFSNEDALLSIGFINPKWADRFRRLTGQHAAGYSTTVSRQMQKKMFALGFPISTKQLMTPARPLVRPVFEENKAQMIERVSQRFMMAITKHFAGEK